MKRILAILLCLTIFLMVPACKPDNIQPPSEIIHPDEEQQNAALEQQEIKPPAAEKQEEDLEKEPAPEEESKPSEEKQEQQEEILPADPANPLAAEDFAPSSTTASALAESGMIKNADPKELFNKRTIKFYTADSEPAFIYADEKGNPVSELDWIKAVAEENGFTVEYSIKPANLSVKSQRLALFAGKDLSLIQLQAKDLAAGLSLCASSKQYLDMDLESFGISKSVLIQSAYKLFAPIGMADSLWYNPALIGETDPAALEQEGKWTIEEFKTICSANAEKKILPLLMESALPWATLSGKAPITLKEGKLDTNINSVGSKEVWSALQGINREIGPFLKDEDQSYSLAAGNAAMEYTTTPKAAKNMTLSYAALPKISADGTTTVTFSGSFFALPKYSSNDSDALAALLFAERWCNRFTETRAAQLQTLGIKGAAYQAYADFVEKKGMLVLYNSTIEEMVAPYLKGLTDDSVNMQQEYLKIINQLYDYVKTQNIYY